MSPLALNAAPARWAARLRAALSSRASPLSYPSSRASSWPAGMSWTELPPQAADATPESVLAAFARLPLDAVLEHLQTHCGGLTDHEADTRRAIKGPNVLPTRRAPSWIMTLLAAIPNPFNVLLIFLAIVQIALPDRDWAAFTVLLVMVVISVVVRFWQEYRSSVAVFRLQSSITNDVKVLRQPSSLPATHALPAKLSPDAASPEARTVPECHLVPGDVVLLGPGSVVPADCIILEASFLRVSQSTWTGESEPVAKAPVADGGDKEASLFDLANVVFMGTSVVSGNGVALVLRTGADVLIAGMAKELEKKRERNAFQTGIRNVSWMLIGFMVVMVPIVSLAPVPLPVISPCSTAPATRSSASAARRRATGTRPPSSASASPSASCPRCCRPLSMPTSRAAPTSCPRKRPLSSGSTRSRTSAPCRPCAATRRAP